MLLNPTTYFLQGDFTVGKVHYIDQAPNEEFNEESEPNNDPKFDRELDPNEEIGDLNLLEPLEDEKVKQRILGEEPELNDKDVSFLPSDAIFRIENSLWEFLFYHKETKLQTDITDFQNAVQNYMSIKGILKLRDLFTLSNNMVINKIYKDHINKNINYSSLCLYHGPLFKTKVWGSEVYVLKNTYKMVFSPYYFYAAGNTLKSGTLLTGDQFLKNSKDFDPFYNYYKTRLDKTLVFQVPHHGSLKNWKMMPNELNSHNIKCFVINHGYGRKKHPEKNMLQNILIFANPLILNNEFTHFQYGIIPCN